MTDAIGDIPKFAAKSAFWAEVRSLARDHLAAEAERGRPSIGDPRAIRHAGAILLWFALSFLNAS